MICYVTCLFSASLLGERPLPLNSKHSYIYIYIGESQYMENYVILQTLPTSQQPNTRLLVHKDSVVFICPFEFVR